jgi:hypothetical protein
MSSRALRLSVAAATLLVFVVLWAVVAARPWATGSERTALDRSLVALNRRQRRLAREARLVKHDLDVRWREYRQRLRKREAQIRALDRRHAAQVAAEAAGAATSSAGAGGTKVVTLPPQVRVVTLPPASAPAVSSGSSHP